MAHNYVGYGDGALTQAHNLAVARRYQPPSRLGVALWLEALFR